MSFVTAPDFETKRLYEATVTADDGFNSSTQDISVRINDIGGSDDDVVLEQVLELELEQELELELELEQELELELEHK